MKAIVIGSGTIGSAVKKALEEKGHQIVTVGRKSGDYQADISDPESLKALFRGPRREHRRAVGKFNQVQGHGPDQPGPGRDPLHSR
jgi:nucleoside-diphosphate-sugar epimerase